MSKYRLSTEAKNDLIRIHHYAFERFGEIQADKYFNAFFDCFDQIAERPYSFESVDFIRPGYRRCLCGSDSIYFKISDQYVDIMAIMGRQDLNNLL